MAFLLLTGGGRLLLEGGGALLLAGVTQPPPVANQGGGGGDGFYGEEWARLYPLKPKRKKRRDARGIPAEWKEPTPAQLPEPASKDAKAGMLAGVQTLRDLAAVAAMQPPREVIPPEWVEDDDDIELLLLA